MSVQNERITTAGICIKEGKILIGQRIPKGSIASKWEFPGGKNRWEESEEETLKREFKEELGVDIEVGKLLATHDFVNKETLYHLKAYQVFIDNEIEDFKLSVHTQLKWEEFENLDDYNFAPSDKSIINQIKENL